MGGKCSGGLTLNLNSPEWNHVDFIRFDIFQCVSLFCSAASDYGLFLSDDDPRKGIWLEAGRTLDYYMLRNGVWCKPVVFFITMFLESFFPEQQEDCLALRRVGRSWVCSWPWPSPFPCCASNVSFFLHSGYDYELLWSVVSSQND